MTVIRVLKYHWTPHPAVRTTWTWCRERPPRCLPSSLLLTRFPRSVPSVLDSMSASRVHSACATTLLEGPGQVKDSLRSGRISRPTQFVR